jgi:capsule biosynthesis phosphatase
MDLDGTLTIDDPRTPYAARAPNLAVVEKLRQYKAAGFEIAIYTARNMRTHEKSVGRINALTLPVVIDWLKRHDIPFDELHVGKPWAGPQGFYVDDRAIRPGEFVALTHAEILQLLNTPTGGQAIDAGAEPPDDPNLEGAP